MTKTYSILISGTDEQAIEEIFTAVVSKFSKYDEALMTTATLTISEK